MTSASETYLYAMPTNGMRRENWWIRGACEIVELWKWGNWDFRVGATALEDKRKKANSEMFDSIIPQFHNSTIKVSAVPQVSRFWDAPTTNGSHLLTWENFFLNRDTNTPVSAQLELMPSGDTLRRV